MTTQEILEAARAAKTVVALASSETRTHALWAMSDWLCHPENMEAILAANAEDMAAAKGHISDVMLDRLALTEERIGAMARGILEVAALPDPVGRVLKRVERPNGNFGPFLPLSSPFLRFSATSGCCVTLTCSSSAFCSTTKRAGCFSACSCS